jgi:Ran GTPase-activating protein (RanGAP) involved in mRNA processing and transport
LETNTTLTTLNLRYNQIGHQGAQFLAVLLEETNTTLITLDLGDNQIGDQCAQFLAVLLEETNTTLTILNLGYNQISNQKMIVKINEKLKINHTNKQRLRCLQIQCLEKLKQLDRIDEIKSFNPIIYESCLMKY